MEPGQLTHLISIEKPTSTQDAVYGEPITTWTLFATAWAKREDLTGRELFLANQTSAQMTTRFTIRYVAGLDEKMRILSNDRTYDIVSLSDPDGRRVKLVILTARQANG